MGQEKINDFELWLEFEALESGNWDIYNEAANIQINMNDGRKYGINVWTYKFLQTIVNIDIANNENLKGLYQTPPDLFVKELTRECITLTIQDLLKKGELEELLNYSIIINSK